MAKKSKSLPQEILVYVQDTADDGTPIYCAATNVNEIPEDMEGVLVGNYYLNNVATFGIKRTLK